MTIETRYYNTEPGNRYITDPYLIHVTPIRVTREGVGFVMLPPDTSTSLPVEVIASNRESNFYINLGMMQFADEFGTETVMIKFKK